MSEQHPEYKIAGQTEIRHGCRLPFADSGYVAPTPDEIREALRRGNFTGAAAGKLLGVTGRTIRKWVGGEPERYGTSYRHEFGERCPRCTAPIETDGHFKWCSNLPVCQWGNEADVGDPPADFYRRGLHDR